MPHADRSFFINKLTAEQDVAFKRHYWFFAIKDLSAKKQYSFIHKPTLSLSDRNWLINAMTPDQKEAYFAYAQQELDASNNNNNNNNNNIIIKPAKSQPTSKKPKKPKPNNSPPASAIPAAAEVPQQVPVRQGLKRRAEPDLEPDLEYLRLVENMSRKFTSPCWNNSHDFVQVRNLLKHVPSLPSNWA